MPAHATASRERYRSLKPDHPDKALIEIVPSADATGSRIRLSGVWVNTALGDALLELDRIDAADGSGAVEFDLSAVSHMDMAGAWLVRRMMTARQGEGRAVTVAGASDAIGELIGALPDSISGPARKDPRAPFFQRIFAPVGAVVVELWGDAVAMMFVLGSAVRGGQMKLGRGAGVSPASVVNQLDHMGVRAVPIIVLMSFLIGAIIAQQGAFQLRYFGAEVFVVDLVGILQLREIGVLLTAIMIAGRSGSAITAEIGAMKMREEIDALKVIGLNPIGVLVFPRLVALTIALPLLTIVANFSALYGAAVVAWAYSDITFEVFATRLHDAVDYSTLASGMIKAPFMALIIGIVSAVEGMKVGGSAESLGQHVTASVVKSIFVVILVDGLFAMFYAAIDF